MEQQLIETVTPSGTYLTRSNGQPAGWILSRDSTHFEFDHGDEV